MADIPENMESQVADGTVQSVQVELGANVNIGGFPIVQRLEADLAEAKAAVEALPAKVEGDVEAKIAAIHKHVDQLKEDVRANLSPLIPTIAHNQFMAFAEELRAKLVALF